MLLSLLLSSQSCNTLFAFFQVLAYIETNLKSIGKVNNKCIILLLFIFIDYLY